jgi:hypothetical protein
VLRKLEGVTCERCQSESIYLTLRMCDDGERRAIWACWVCGRTVDKQYVEVEQQ